MRSGPSWRPAPHLETLQGAVIGGLQVRLGYADRKGHVTTRIIHPLGLVTKSKVWYLIAGTGGGQRTFRVDRVSGVELTGEPVVRPLDFGLHRAWEEIVATVDVLRSPAHVDAVAEPGVVDVLRWMSERQLDVGRRRPDGRLPVTVRGQDPEIIAARLAGFGARVEVVAPAAARDYLARVGGELAVLYGASAESNAVPGSREEANDSLTEPSTENTPVTRGPSR